MKKYTLFTISALVRALSLNAYADVTTAASTENQGVPLTAAIRAVYSNEIEFKALPLMRFAQFATEKTELGTQPGLSISMLSYDNLKLGGKLVENVPMQSQALAGSLKQITVTEHGNAVSNSELLIESSFDDVMATTTTLLGRDYAMVLDTELRDTALSGTNVIYARKANGTVVTSRAGLIDECTFKVSTVKDALEILSTNNAPKREGYWICFVHPHQSRGLRDDSAWINASNYGNPEQLFNGEIGRIDDTRFIETSIMSNGAASATNPAYDETLVHGYEDADHNVNAVDVYKACIFGDRYYGIAWSLPVELRDNGIQDYGRTRSLAWYAIYGTGILNNDYGVVIETA